MNAEEYAATKDLPVGLPDVHAAVVRAMLRNAFMAGQACGIQEAGEIHKRVFAAPARSPVDALVDDD